MTTKFLLSYCRSSGSSVSNAQVALTGRHHQCVRFGCRPPSRQSGGLDSVCFPPHGCGQAGRQARTHTDRHPHTEAGASLGQAAAGLLAPGLRHAQRRTRTRTRMASRVQTRTSLSRRVFNCCTPGVDLAPPTPSRAALPPRWRSCLVGSSTSIPPG